MIQTNNESIYQIKHLVDNPSNTNKFIYVDSIDGNLVIKDNKWFFDLNYYVIDNAILPPNIFTSNLELPFVSIKDVGLVYSQSATIPDWVVQKDQCKIYKATFNIDTSESKFFEQMLNEYLMYLEFSFDINSDVINNSHIDVPQNDLDNFINEWNLIHMTLNFDFSNFIYVLDDCGSFENGNQFYLNSKNGYAASENNIFYKINNNLNSKVTPIKNLLTLKTIQPFWINKIVKRFYYSLDNDPTIKCYESIDSDQIYVYESYDIDFDGITTFDKNKNEVIKTLDGIDGFYIPKKAKGYMEITLLLSQNENSKTYCFKKGFDFAGNEDDSQVQIKKLFINDLTNFERLQF